MTSAVTTSSGAPVTPETPSVLFVCVRNGGKSQMAAALARLHGGDGVVVHSAGTDPGSAVSTEAAASVEQVGATFRGEYPKAIFPAWLDEVGRVVLVGGEVELPSVGSAPVERWEVDEPSLRGIEGQERLALIRDELDGRVRALLEEMRQTPASA